MMLTEIQRQGSTKSSRRIGTAESYVVIQMVILASIVEREVRFNQDRPFVASVFWNRIYKPNDETIGRLQDDPQWNMHVTHSLETDGLLEAASGCWWQHCL